MNTISGVTAIGAGASHSLAVDGNGNAWTWGYNGYGQLGDGTSTARNTPTLISFVPLGLAIAGGANHSVALMTDGSVWTWGYNLFGQLGDGTTTQRTSPVQVIAASAVATPEFSVGTGTYSTEQTVTVTCATPDATTHYTTTGVDPTEQDPTVVSGGTVSITQTTTLKAKAWKEGETESSVATAVYTLAVATPMLSPGSGTYGAAQTVTASTTSPGATLRHTLDGSDPTEASAVYSTPLYVDTATTAKVKGFRDGWITSVTAMATYAFNYGTLGAPTFDPTGGPYISGQLVSLSAAAGTTIRYTADGSDPSSGSPIYTAPIALATSLTLKARAFHPDWTPSATSAETYTIQVAAPTLDPSAGTYPAGQLVTVTSPTAGATLRYTTNGADPTPADPIITSGGTLVLGNYTLKVKAWMAGAEPSAVTAATYATSGSLTTATMAGGGSHALAVEPDGTPWAWGANGSGQVGDLTTTGRLVPTPVYGLVGVVAVAGGGTHSVALTADGSVWSWGVNAFGQLGDGSTTLRLSPVPVGGLSGVVAVAAGTDHSLALKSDGTVWAWGRNHTGQLGDGTTTQRLTPVQVSTLTGIVAISTRGAHSLALKSDGTVWAWGANGNGQLGDGTTTPRTSPVAVSGLTGVTAVAAGGSHSLGVKSDGTVWGWGFNYYGQVGDGSQTQRLTPVQAATLTGALSVKAGASHSLGVKSDGTVWGWGFNFYGQVGDGTTTARATPTQVSSLNTIVAIGAGDSHSLALASDGAAWAWGRNDHGPLGDGTATSRTTPVQMALAGMGWKLAAPVLGVASGTYVVDQSVTVTAADPEATLHYTTTGEAPTELDATVAWGASVAVGESLTLTVGAWKAGSIPSELTAATYELKAVVPTFAPGTDAYATPPSVTIGSTTAGATLTYTVDGSEPTDTSTTYTEPVVVATTGTLKARTFKAGWTPSDSGAASYWVDQGAVATPTIAPEGDTYEAAPLVSLACTTTGATIRYTLDGTDPGPSSEPYRYPFLVRTTATVKARAFLPGLAPSAVASETYDLDAVDQSGVPDIVPGGGWFATGLTIAITGAQGATLRYTTSGIDPEDTDTQVPGPGTLDVTASQVVKVRAWESGLSPSGVRRADFVVTGAIASGREHSLALAADGTVWAWGRGTEGELGDGTGLNRDTPVSPLGSAIAIAGGRWHSLAVLADGTVRSWGDNAYGQLGEGTTGRRYAPYTVTGLSNVVAVAAGYDHSLALKSDGTVWAWGGNTYGQLGDGTTTQHLTAVQVTGLSGVTSIAAGDGFSVAVQRDGAAGGLVWAWGRNDTGQLGDGSGLPRVVPVRVGEMADAVQVAAGQAFAVARLADGSVVAWGANDVGQLGTLTGAPSFTPVVVPVLADTRSVAAGVGHALATDADGRVWGWGTNTGGQLGTPLSSGTTAVGAPQRMPGVAAALGVAAGWLHALVLRTDGHVWGVGTLAANGLGGQMHAAAEEIPNLSLVSNAWLLDDQDEDGLVTWHEYLAGTDPLVADSNGNGLSDLVDVRRRSEAANPDDDGDGLPNAVELLLGTDPFRADTDGDGTSDLEDFYPLDPTRTSLPAPDPYDTTPPTITLIYPTNARLVGGGD